ncbi:MAG TPA: DUF1839 family protein [Candidatus Kapabacteria bacterium]|nr:DUF1839 family protein [Candidatus Kapabacteria bacterium]
MKQILTLDPATYRRHAIHGPDRVWAETNCYVDLLIELIHANGFEPVAALPFTLGIGFEGDQWTFFKFSHHDLQTLFGIEIQELAIWRPVIDHIEEQVGAGKPVLVELDSWYLPDTAGTAYQLDHVKTTVAVNLIDRANRRLGYFHNQGYFELQGDDFTQIFQLDGLVHPRMLPPYVEFARFHDGGLHGQALLEASLAVLKHQLPLIPRSNPFTAFKARFAQDIDWLMQSDISLFHKYSFATLRQYGACFELAQTYTQWLQDQGVDGVAPATAAFAEISQGAKAFQFQLARAMARKKPLDLTPIDNMGAAWEKGMAALNLRFNR